MTSKKTPNKIPRAMSHAVVGRIDLETQRANCATHSAIARNDLHYRIWSEIAQTGEGNCRAGWTIPVTRAEHLQAVGVLKGCANAAEYHARDAASRLAFINKFDGRIKVLSRHDGPVSAHQALLEYRRHFYTDLEVIQTPDA